MTCMKCGTMYPVNYENCPKCKSSEAKQTQYKVAKDKKIEIFDEPTNFLVIAGEISQGEADTQR